MGNETPAIRCPRSGRLLTPESLYYWKLKKTLTTLLSSDDDDPVTETPIRERQTKIEMKLEMIQFTDVYEDSNDSIGKHGKSSEKPTSASDLSTSIIHTPRSRAIQMRIETSSEDEQYATSSYNTDEAEVLSPVLAKATHASASAGSSESSSSIQFGQENTVNKKDYCCSVIEISSDDDSFQLPANRFKSPEFSQKRTKTSTESQIFSAPPVTPATLKGPRMGKRLAVTEPQKRQKKTSTQKEEPVTERKRSVKINRQSESDNESFDALLSELRNCKLRDDKCNKTQADPNDTLARWESSNKDDRHFLASLSEEIPLEGCHPNAAYYRRQSFNTIRHELTEKLYELFHRIIFQNRFVERLPVSWNNRLLTTAGWCICKKHLDGTKYSEIELSTKVLDRPDRLRDTLVHEMCHAGAWIIHGYKGDHGPLFNFWGQRAGELLGLKVTTCHSYAVEKRYVYKCEKCENEIGRHSKSLDTNKLVCARCKGRFYLRINSGQRW
ncbi:acidic repeat-containing protein-like isoform X2 [Varroa jacobsoni]|uniref:acidic repeat-containing protein-like isoform X2 n=1 Tax=Varroa jacobsoni TaxID=62625 RepID=UPI000BF750D2|nr:acidic repeat-containing protein-like isoform X2 [Varroa jacobsoni]